MSPESLAPGRAYYRLTFADPDLTIPGVEPMIYIGANLFPEEDPRPGTVHYFQDTVSHRFCGSVVSDDHRPHPDIEALIYPFDEEALEEDLHDLDGIIAALTEARQRSAPAA